LITSNKKPQKLVKQSPQPIKEEENNNILDYDYINSSNAIEKAKVEPKQEQSIKQSYQPLFVSDISTTP